MSDEDELWRAPPRDFTKVRDALVAALAADPARKAAVKALRRPQPQVWAWNRLMLDGDEAAVEAMEAVDDVAELLANEDRAQEDVADATARLRAAATMLARRATQLAHAEGLGWAVAQDRALGVLVEALPWDASAREAARKGHLPDAPAPVDPLEAMRVLASGEKPRPAAPAPTEKPARGKKKTTAAEDEEAARAEREAKAAAAERAAHERALAQAQQAHTASASALAAARAEVERAERALAEARRHADEALAEERRRAAALDEARARLTSH